MSNDNSLHADSHRSIMKSTSIVAAGTLASRILGFLRDVVLAKYFGTGFKADALFVAFRIPNLFRDLVGEGATNSVLVPVFSEYLIKKEKQEFWKFVNAIFTVGLLVLSAITLLGVLLSPAIVRLIAPGFIEDQEKLKLTVRLTKIMFPYLIFMGLTAYSMAVLYVFRSFFAPAFSPCLLNIAMIAATLLSVRYLKEPVYGLAIGVLVGGFLQFVFQLPPLIKRGIKLEKPETLRHPGVVQVGKLLLPRLFGASVYQLSAFIDTFCASFATIVGMGGISAVYYATRIVQFPMGIFGFSLASASLPVLASLANRDEIEQFKKTIIFSLENILFVMLPMSIVLVFLGHPMVRLLFERGTFDAYSTAITSSALVFYALGLAGFGGVKIMVTAFYALQDTKTPVKVAAVCLVINAGFNFLLMWPMKISGIALANSISATVNLAALFWLMQKKIGAFPAGFKEFILKCLLATAATALFIEIFWRTALPAPEFVKLFLAVFLGFVVYVFSCLALKVKQAQEILGFIIGKIK
jgi:putative peptidoglycan lipid II flippase